MAWDITKRPIFTEISQEHLQELRDRRISLYNLMILLVVISIVPYKTNNE